MNLSVGAVVLAAGEGKRLKLNAPKPLAPCLDKKLVDFPLKELKRFFNTNSLQGTVTAVIGHQRDLVKGYIEARYPEIKYAIQEKQIGTADALMAYFNSSEETKKYDLTLVICADTPVVSEAELSAMFKEFSNEHCDAVAATFIESNPFGLGRILRSEKGFEIVEEKDATDEQRKITEVNSGVYIMKTAYVLEHLKNINSNNKSGEFYLTDVFKKGLNVKACCFPNGNVFLGVNTLEQLESVENVLRQRKINELRANGVRFIDSKNTYIDSEVEIGSGSVIYPNTFITGKTKIGENVVIEMGVQIQNSVVESNATILAHSILESAKVASKAAIGPFARLRPGSDIGVEAKIGNFVEIKKSVLDKGVKVSHLSYVGDAFIGEETNIGCGFITCNYDGANKFVTKIGKNCFIGSDSQAVAPIEIGDNCFVAASSTVTKNMPNGSFAISRAPLSIKEEMAKRFLKTKEKK